MVSPLAQNGHLHMATINSDSPPTPSTGSGTTQETISAVEASISTKRVLQESSSRVEMDLKRPKLDKDKRAASKIDLSNETFQEWDAVDPRIVPKAEEAVWLLVSTLNKS